MKFHLEGIGGPGTRARAGTLTTLHGEVRTPVFMPVGTQATVKAQSFETLEATGAPVLLANTYHLLLRPGPEVFRKLGGIHRFMNWNRSVLTDSGGYQIFSLHEARRMDEAGASFKSYVTHEEILLTPELSIETQKAIGSDIMMALDQCIPSTAGRAEAEAAMQLTHRWARRSLAARGESPQALFGIVQGACFEDLRRQSAAELTALPFDGFAIGGLAVGETRAQREDFTELTAALLPSDKPRYLMGVGTPIDILEAIHRGVDMFDCIIPVSYAQRGVAFTSEGKLQLRRTTYRLSEERLDPACPCPTCAAYSRAYLHHLIKSSEVLGWQLLGAHNLHCYQRLTRAAREAILAGRFEEFYLRERVTLNRGDGDETPARPRGRVPKRERLTLGDYEVVLSPSGFSAVRQTSSGETMHSVNSPSEEARRVYVEPSRLEERLRIGKDELILWDVGLGAATNAMEAILLRERLGPEAAPLHVVSFERDLDPLRLALQHQNRFLHLRHRAPGALLRDRAWSAPGLRWTLITGDFLETMSEAPAPDLIYFDPFSSKVDSKLWQPECFRRLRKLCLVRPAQLFTYSNSTAVRAALLEAGFFVGRGPATGPKAETTVAWTDAALPVGAPLGASDWLPRWERSGAKVPAGIGAEEIPAFENAVRGHPQFAQP